MHILTMLCRAHLGADPCSQGRAWLHPGMLDPAQQQWFTDLWGPHGAWPEWRRCTAARCPMWPRLEGREARVWTGNGNKGPWGMTDQAQTRSQRRPSSGVDPMGEKVEEQDCPQNLSK